MLQFQRVSQSQRQFLNHKVRALQFHSANQHHSVSQQAQAPQFQRVNQSQRQSLNRKAQALQSQRANQFLIH